MTNTPSTAPRSTSSADATPNANHCPTCAESGRDERDCEGHGFHGCRVCGTGAGLCTKHDRERKERRQRPLDVMRSDDPPPTWQQKLASRVLAVLHPSSTATTRIDGNRAVELTAAIVAIAVECVAPKQPTVDVDDAGDAMPAWRRKLGERVCEIILADFREDIDRARALDLAAKVCTFFDEAVTAADDLLHQFGERHEQQLAELRAAQHELGQLKITHAQLGRDFDERCTAYHVTAIELERCRDELQHARIELDAAKARIERDARNHGGN